MRVYLCHHRFHLHIAIKLKEKELCRVVFLFPPYRSERSGSMRRGPKFQKCSLMESRGHRDLMPI